MKQFIKIFFFGICLTGLLQGCYKDEGNYDLIEYNRIKEIRSFSSNQVILGDTLRVKPLFTWTNATADTMNFDYEWRQIDSVVSNQRDLAYKPDISGYFNIYLYVTERATGIVSRFAMQVQAISAYKAGWLLLTNDGGKSGLSYIRRDAKKDAAGVTYYEYKLYDDIYATTFPGAQLGEGPVKLATKIFPDYTLDEVMVVQENSSVYLNGDNFSKVIQLKSEFPNQTIPENAKVLNYADGGSANFILTDDGKVYWKRNSVGMGGLHQGMFFNVPIYFEGGDADITSIIDTEHDNAQFLYTYDELNKRFVGVYTTNGSNDYLGSKLFLVDQETPPAGFIDLNNQAGYKHIYTSDYSSGALYMNIIKNNNTGQYLLQNYRLAMNWTNIGVSEHKQEVFAGTALVSDNTVYYRIRNSSYLFFGEGSKLYFYDVNTKMVKLYHDFGNGVIVKMTSDAPSGELGVALNNGKFHIVSLKNEVLGNGNPGSVGLLYSSPTLKSIVDLQWKWGSYFEYVFKRYP